jgi:hypothetical protein
MAPDLRSVAVFLLSAVFVLGSSSVLAQQPSPDDPAEDPRRVHDGPSAAERGLRHLHQRLPAGVLDRIRRQQAARQQAGRKQPLPLTNAAGTSIPAVSPKQTWIRNANPEPKRNFDLVGTPVSAGDVNGDGTNDYLYTTSTARDERTSALEDVTGKTALFFGGTPSSGEDQLLYTQLVPIGDLNDDGDDDALSFDASSGAIDVYLGSDTGYQSTQTSVTTAVANPIVRGFADLDGDGIEDVVVGDADQNRIAVLYGASSLSGVELRSYTPSVESGGEFRYAVGNVDETGAGEIARFRFQEPDDVRIQLLRGAQDRSLTTVQSFTPSESISDPQFDLWTLDLDGSAGLELFLGGPGGTASYAFELAGDGSYQTSSAGEYVGALNPVGDLNGDGRHDFILSGDAVVFGPQNLADNLNTSAVSLPQDGGEMVRVDRTHRRPLGDVTGDGRPNVIASYQTTTSSNLRVGRRFISLDAGTRTIRQPEDVTEPRENFVDRIDETNEVGDVNEDGVTDFALVRNDLGTVEIYFGGSTIPQTPDRVITPPVDTLVAGSVSGGDFNGDGASDILVGYGPLSNPIDQTVRNDVYLGGSSFDVTSDHTASATDAGFDLDLPRAIGDVNGDGATDWLASSRDRSTDQHVALFLGGSPLPDTPSETITFTSSSPVQFLGEVKAGVGDVNGDGYDDFAFDDTIDEEILVFFGGENPSYTSTSGVALPVRPYAGIAGGDFNGDGVSDVAALSFYQGGVDDVTIELFYGSSSFDAIADQELTIPANGPGDFDGDGSAEQSIGVLEGAGDVDGDGADELLHGSSFVGLATDAYLYRPSTSDAPIRRLQAPNQNAALGSQQFIYSTAIGDFTGNGSVDFVGTQFNDDNDAYQSSRVYRYDLQTPAARASRQIDSDGVVSFGDTGIALGFTDLQASGSVTVTLYRNAPTNVSGISRDAVSEYRVVVDADPSLDFDTATVRWKVSDFEGITDPSTVDVYRRDQAGTGTFTELDTNVNDQGTSDPGDDVIAGTTSEFSEFVLASDTNPLPVEMGSIEAAASENGVRLTWSTLSEHDNTEFRIQRRREAPAAQGTDRQASTWTTVGRVAGAGTTTEAQSYRFVDDDPPFEANRLAYRLKQVDADGDVHYSSTVTVQRAVDEATLQSVYPNPARQEAVVRFAVPERQRVTIRLYDVLGRRVETIVDEPVRGRRQMRVDVSDLASGAYFLRFRAGGASFTRQVTVVK